MPKVSGNLMKQRISDRTRRGVPLLIKGCSRTFLQSYVRAFDRWRGSNRSRSFRSTVFRVQQRPAWWRREWERAVAWGERRQTGKFGRKCCKRRDAVPGTDTFVDNLLKEVGMSPNNLSDLTNLNVRLPDSNAAKPAQGKAPKRESKS